MKRTPVQCLTSVFLGVLACLFLITPARPAQAATTFFSENWDTGAPPASWPNCGSGTSFDGWYPRDYTDGCGSGVGLDSSIYHSAPRSFHNRRPAGTSWDLTSLWHNLPANTGKVYLRMYLYFPTAGWSNFDPAGTWSTAGNEVMHFIFTNSAASNTGFRINLYDNASDTWSPAPECYGGKNGSTSHTGPGMYLALEVDGGGGHNSFGTTKGAYPAGCWNLHDHLGEWHSHEWMIDAVNNLVSYWIDGNPMYTNVPVPVGYVGGVRHPSIDKIMLSLFDSYADNWTADVYMDDIVASDSYIGPMTGSVTPAKPSPPVLH